MIAELQKLVQRIYVCNYRATNIKLFFKKIVMNFSAFLIMFWNDVSSLVFCIEIG